MIHFSDDELARRQARIVMDQQVPPLQIAAVQGLVRRCAAGELRKMFAEAGLFSNAGIAEAFGVVLSTATKWQKGAVGIPQTHHLLRLLELLRAEAKRTAA